MKSLTSDVIDVYVRKSIFLLLFDFLHLCHITQIWLLDFASVNSFDTVSVNNKE